MAGRFSFSMPERRDASDPWFRIGTLDITTTMLVVIGCVAGLFVWAFSSAHGELFWLDPDGVKSSFQLWRLFTWPLINEPSLWSVISIAIFWYFGSQVERLLGRNKFGIMLLLLAVVPGLVAVLLEVGYAGLTPIELAVFLVFIAEYPTARFFFGIPAWAIGAVIVGIQLLQYIGLRDRDGLILMLVTIVVAALSARAMGLAQSLPWIPKIPIPSGAARKRRKAARRNRGRGDVISGPWGSTSRTEPYRGSSLPQPPRPAEDPRDQEELDDLLDKIREGGGLDALSAAERRRLNEISQRLRKNRR
jgi:membrane associated rhomboid family serine protease